MGKDKIKDGDAATSTDASRDHSRDQESRDSALAKTVTEAVAGAFTKQKADETKFITEAFTRQMEKTQAQYEELLKASRTQNFLQPLRLLQVQMVLELWTPLTGQWTKTSTRDGSYGHTRQDLH